MENCIYKWFHAFLRFKLFGHKLGLCKFCDIEKVCSHCVRYGCRVLSISFEAIQILRLLWKICRYIIMAILVLNIAGKVFSICCKANVSFSPLLFISFKYLLLICFYMISTYHSKYRSQVSSISPPCATQYANGPVISRLLPLIWRQKKPH